MFEEFLGKKYVTGLLLSSLSLPTASLSSIQFCHSISFSQQITKRLFLNPVYTILPAFVQMCGNLLICKLQICSLHNALQQISAYFLPRQQVSLLRREIMYLDTLRLLMHYLYSDIILSGGAPCQSIKRSSRVPPP